MRDPARIDKFCDEFATIWKEYFPDYRWGQLCSNFFGWLASTKQVDLFFPEEGRMLEYLHEYCQQRNVSPWKKGDN